MNKYNIGIDIDGTLTEPDFWVETMNRYFNKEINYHENRVYDWLEAYDLSYEEFEKFYKTEGPRMHLEAKIRPGAKKVISYFSKHFNIYYLTARQSWLEPVTAKWLSKHELPGEHYVLGTHKKLPYARKLSCDFFIEDNINVARELASDGIKVVLINCPYNMNSNLNKNIIRVDNWIEIRKVINQLAGNLI